MTAGIGLRRKGGWTRFAVQAGWAALALVLARPAHAQRIAQFLSPAVPGFGTQAGVTVLSRSRPQYDALGVHVGDFLVNARMDEYLGYDTNVQGTNRGPGSSFIQTSPQVNAASNWSRNRLAVSLGLDNYSYFNVKNEAYTNINASIGGGLTIGRHDLNVGYSHLDQHELGTDIGSVGFGQPIAYKVDAVRSDYSIERGRFTFIPNVDVERFQFSNTVQNGVAIDEAFRNRVVAFGGVTTRYEVSQQRSVILILQGGTSQFSRIPSGIPSPTSVSEVVLAGVDYQATGPWRYRLLVGLERRQFQAASFSTHTAPIIQGDVFWTPTGRTTLTGSVRRQIEDPEAELASGYTFTSVGLTVDHELYRNILLQGRATFLAADYLSGGGGSAASYSGGGGVSWLINRRLRLSADYDFTRQVGTNGSVNISTVNQPLLATANDTGLLNNFTSGSYTRNVFLLGLHLRL